MSKNIPKKLQIKAEFLRHLDTAKGMMERGKASSEVKVEYLDRIINDIDLFDDNRLEDLRIFWYGVFQKS